MPKLSTETRLTRLVNLDWLIQRNAVFLAMARTRIGAESPPTAVDDSELLTYTELVASQSCLVESRSVLRATLCS
jgi:hypothetical protein